jgi:quercetin dioxygenase-like cupin family protein
MSIPPHAPDRKRWHLGGLLSIAATAGDTDGALSVVEERAARGFATPAHVHGREDETLFVIDGELKYVLDGTPGTAAAGSAVHLPRGVPHQFEVTSTEAHFLVIITPGGFEQFFWDVSPAAEAPRLPGNGDDAYTSLQAMIDMAAALGTTVFHSGQEAIRAAAHTAATSSNGKEILRAYRELGAALAGPAPLPEDLSEAVDLLVTAVAQRNPAYPRALILLGIMIERANAVVPLPPLVQAVRPDLSDAEALAFAYALAHFPDQAEAVTAAMASVDLPDPDRERLLRCLQQPVPEVLHRIGRVWPSPTVWRLDETERELDDAWRGRLDLADDTAKQLWEAETVALLAFMGARADQAVERATGHA